MIACLATHLRVPVIVAAESYKFTDKVQIDSIVYNELADPHALMQAVDPAGPESTPSLSTPTCPYVPRSRWPQGAASASSGATAPPQTPPYDLLHLRYDVTPIRNVSAVVTEIGMIPPTSVPVLIRELRYDGQGGKR